MGQKCCGDNLICSADGIGGEMTCKEKPPKCTNILPSEQKCLAEGGLAKGNKCDSTNGHKCCGKTMYCCFKDWICKDRKDEGMYSRSRSAKPKAKENPHFGDGPFIGSPFFTLILIKPALIIRLKYTKSTR